MRFAVGDSVWYDNSKGRVMSEAESLNLAFTTIVRVEVDWDNGARTIVWESDLMTDAEHAEG